MLKSLLFIILLTGSIIAQTANQTDVWKHFRFFVGSWEGTGKGEPGESKVEREYKFILNGRFLQASHKSIYAPQTKNPKGEIHEDLGFFSYDRSRKQFVFWQFHTEGFVNGYVSTNISEDGKTIVFTTESIENIPSDFRAKENYKILNENDFTETFELAEPNKEYAIYSENHFTRKKNN